MDKLQNILLILKEMGCSGIKVSFEDEGALYNEIITMRNLTANVGLDLTVKIGGCEAKRDIIDCIDLDCDTIVAPMIESGFALNKFLKSLESCNYSKKKGFNLETIQGYNNLKELSKSFDSIEYITLGRHDFVKSLSKDSEHVDSEELYEIAEKLFTFVKNNHKNVKCYMGGNLSKNSINFIQKLIEKKLLDAFESRYIIFNIHKIHDINDLDKHIELAQMFEYEWLNLIRNRYLTQANKDIKRIETIKNKINNNTSFV
jgi:hypothetical protein